MPPAPQRLAPAGLASARRSAGLLLLGLVATYLDLPCKAVALVPLTLAAWETVRRCGTCPAPARPAGRWCGRGSAWR